MNSSLNKHNLAYVRGFQAGLTEGARRRDQAVFDIVKVSRTPLTLVINPGKATAMDVVAGLSEQIMTMLDMSRTMNANVIKVLSDREALVTLSTELLDITASLVERTRGNMSEQEHANYVAQLRSVREDFKKAREDALSRSGCPVRIAD